MKLSRIEKTEQESTDLALHSELCSQRYEGILIKLENIDEKLRSAADALIEIKMKMHENKDSVYLKWCIAIITALVAALLHLLVK
jgi:hypothetical protein